MTDDEDFFVGRGAAASAESALAEALSEHRRVNHEVYRRWQQGGRVLDCYSWSIQQI